MSVGDISAAVRVCPRTLRYSFEHVLGVTPTQYVRAQRLNRVRRDLMAGRNDSIQTAAARWGFWHMGRFAQFYRQSFINRNSGFGSSIAIVLLLAVIPVMIYNLRQLREQEAFR